MTPHSLTWLQLATDDTVVLLDKRQTLQKLRSFFHDMLVELSSVTGAQRWYCAFCGKTTDFLMFQKLANKTFSTTHSSECRGTLILRELQQLLMP